MAVHLKNSVPIFKESKKSRPSSGVVAYSGHAYLKLEELRLEKIAMNLVKTVVEGRLEKR